MATPVEQELRKAVADLDMLKVKGQVRLSGVRLERGGSGVVVDLLFASSGIENEVIASATRLLVLPRLSAPVATTGHLIALKTLAGRSQDLTDLGALIPAASAEDLDVARRARPPYSGTWFQPRARRRG
jgi:hypothetical protein